ncbi:MAG TPA: hypothetical protein VMG10_05055 [Gemmataceae bacterium]|nr:hypothetical protein [Gemmataceae bacterium]
MANLAGVADAELLPVAGRLEVIPWPGSQPDDFQTARASASPATARASASPPTARARTAEVAD